MDTRIPIEAFAHYPTARLEGATAGTRYSAAMEAVEASLVARRKANLELRKQAAEPDWREVYVVGWHHIKYLER